MNQERKNPGSPVLTLFVTESVTEDIDLSSLPLTIGSGPDNDIVILHCDVAHSHLKIYVAGDRVMIAALEDGAVTLINGTSLKGEAALKNNDVIAIGRLQLCAGGFAEEAAEPETARVQETPPSSAFDVTEDTSASGKAIVPKVEVGPQTQEVLNVFAMFENLASIDGLSELCNVILQYARKFIPTLQQGAILAVDENGQRFIPIMKKNFGDLKAGSADKESLWKAVRNSYPVFMALTGKNGGARISVPVKGSGTAVAVLQLVTLESDPDKLQDGIAGLQKLLGYASSHLEARILRRMMEKWQLGAAHVVIASINAKDTYTGGHSERVSRFSMAMAEELELAAEEKVQLLTCSLCHDIGKIGVPDQILKKAAMLSDDEFDEMRDHPVIGADILQRLPYSEKIIPGVRHHHERWDGSGYPDGLKGEEIPLFARIIAIADAFDAMISGRSYSGYMTEEQAVARLQELAHFFDPKILAAFITAHKKGALTLRTGTQIA